MLRKILILLGIIVAFNMIIIRKKSGINISFEHIPSE